MSCIPQNEMVVLAGDIKVHIESSNVGYDGMHGVFGYGDRITDGYRILEFTGGLNLVICNTSFMKQESQSVTYAAGPVKSMVDYIIMWQEDKVKVRNVKVIANEECVPKHKLLLMDMRLCSLIQQKDGIRSLNRECVYGSSRRKRREEYKSVVKDKVDEPEWKYLDVNEHWQQMQNMMMETAQVTCGLLKGPCRHKETWWWNEELAEAVREMKKKYGNWKKRKLNRGVEGV